LYFVRARGNEEQVQLADGEDSVTTLVLPSGPLVTGRVRDEAFAGAASWRIVAELLAADGDWVASVEKSFEAKSDTAGAFALHLPTAGSYRLTVRDIHDVGVASQAIAVDWNEVKALDFVLSGGSVTGVVRDAASELPVSATVRLSKQKSDIEQTVTTDAAGAFALAHLDAGEYTLLVDSTGYCEVRSTFRLTASQALDLGALRLDRGSLLDVALTMPPTLRAAVSIFLVNSASGSIQDRRAKPEDAIRFAGVPPGRYQVVAAEFWFADSALEARVGRPARVFAEVGVDIPPGHGTTAVTLSIR
jgi:hypothetical protein